MVVWPRQKGFDGDSEAVTGQKVGCVPHPDLAKRYQLADDKADKLSYADKSSASTVRTWVGNIWSINTVGASSSIIQVKHV